MYTAVQHSAFGYSDDPTFKHGLESRAVDTKREQNSVIAAGGVLLPTYSAIEDYCEREMFPEDYEGLIPNAQGAFSVRQIDGLAIYIPKGGMTGGR